VHSFCIELMPDFEPTSEVIMIIPFLKSGISSFNHVLDFLFLFTHRTQCLSL
jgi:hypothetical protein